MDVRKQRERRFPWGLWFLALLVFGAAYAFFVLPHQIGKREMKITVINQEPKL